MYCIIIQIGMTFENLESQLATMYYGVAIISGLLKIIGLFRRKLSLL